MVKVNLELLQVKIIEKVNNSNNERENDKTSIGRLIYKHLMNGVSHMLPFVVSGGVLVAISFLWGIFFSRSDKRAIQ